MPNMPIMLLRNCYASLECLIDDCYLGIIGKLTMETHEFESRQFLVRARVEEL